MKSSKFSLKISVGVCLVCSLILIVLTVLGPKIFEAYMTAYRGFSENGESLKMLKKVFALCFYPCVPFAAAILYSLLRLLFNINRNKIFVRKNSSYLKTVSYCCFVIGLITLAGAFFYMPFMFVAFAGIFTGTLLRVLKNVMQNAVLMREENDLTI